MAGQLMRPSVSRCGLAPDAQALLATRVYEGDGSAEDEVARLFHRRVLVMMLSRVGDVEAARDLTQEVLLAVVLALRRGRLREGEKLAAFVYGTARNVVNGFFRSKPPDVEPLSAESARSAADEMLEALHQTSLVARLLKGLDATDRRIFDLILVEGLRSGEVARRLGLSAEVVRARKSRAIKKAIECFRPTLAWSTTRPAEQE